MEQNDNTLTISLRALISLKVLTEQSGWYKPHPDIMQVLNFIDDLSEVIENNFTKDSDQSLDFVVPISFCEETKSIIRLCIDHSIENGLIKLSPDMRTLIRYVYT